MIKRLRIKFVCINMVLVTVILAVLLILMYQQTGRELEFRAVEALKQAASMEPGRPGRPGAGSAVPSFTLRYGPDQQLMVTGDEFYDLTDRQLLERIYMYAQKDQQEYGILERYNLRYYRDQSPKGVRFVFMDCSAEIETLQGLLRNSLLIGLAGFLGFLGISILLARWAVRPVELAWQQQRQFVADASHELKTPLTVILTNAELLQSQEYNPTEKERFAASILAKTRQMRQLVENLLELARADNGQVRTTMQTVDYSRLAEETVLVFEPVYFERGLILESSIAPEIRVKGSQEHLRQVVEILLDNGQKYSAAGGTVRLALSRYGRDKSLLTVTTLGQPLTARQCKDVFKRFYRADEARSSGGYGLGLSIAHRIVTEHGGKIWAQSGEGQNSFFVVI